VPADLADRLAEILGQEVRRLVPIERGHIANRRYRVELADGRNDFVKEPTSAWTAAILADEARSYAAIGPRPFLPNLVASADDLLVVEFVEGAHWPPPWRPGDLPIVDALIDRLSSEPAPSGLRDLEDDDRHRVWHRVAADPDPFLALAVCDRGWFASAVDRLVATDACPLGGRALVHGDLRSDNLALVGDRGVAVDWGAAARGRSDYDRVSFAIPLAIETGRPPDELAPDADPALVAVFAGTYAHAAATPAIPQPIRAQLEGFLRVALPWAARRLGLRPATSASP
jgi:hypothetical protein